MGKVSGTKQAVHENLHIDLYNSKSYQATLK